MPYDKIAQEISSIFRWCLNKFASINEFQNSVSVSLTKPYESKFKNLHKFFKILSKWEKRSSILSIAVEQALSEQTESKSTKSLKSFFLIHWKQIWHFVEFRVFSGILSCLERLTFKWVCDTENNRSSLTRLICYGISLNTAWAGPTGKRTIWKFERSPWSPSHVHLPVEPALFAFSKMVHGK